MSAEEAIALFLDKQTLTNTTDHHADHTEPPHHRLHPHHSRATTQPTPTPTQIKLHSIHNTGQRPHTGRPHICEDPHLPALHHIFDFNDY